MNSPEPVAPVVIRPSVGRKVWYRPSAHDLIGVGAMSVAGGQPLDATILAVWGDRCINVQVLDSYGKPFAKTSVTLLQDGDTPPMNGPKDKEGNPTPGGYVEWMPYQKGQASKAA
jgi:hypothetical protein